MNMGTIEMGVVEWETSRLSTGAAPNTPANEEHWGGDVLLFEDGSTAQHENGTYDGWDTEYSCWVVTGELARRYATMAGSV
jgi:hypothetical protein